MAKNVCENCGRIVEGNQICPNCGKSSFSEDWRGRVIIIDPKNSRIAERMGVGAPGRYALSCSRVSEGGTDQR